MLEGDEVEKKFYEAMSSITPNHLCVARRELGYFDFFVTSDWILEQTTNPLSELTVALLDVLRHFSVCGRSTLHQNFSLQLDYVKLQTVCAGFTPVSGGQIYQAVTSFGERHPNVVDDSGWIYFDLLAQEKFHGSAALAWSIIRGKIAKIWM